MKIRFLSLINKFVHKGSFILINSLKEPGIRKNQIELIKQNYDLNTRRLIVFLTSGYDMITGGILSISSLYEETKKIEEIHGFQTILSTVPGEPLLLKYTKFENKNYIYNFSQILAYFKDLDSLLIHIPEYACIHFLNNISKEEYSILDNISDLQFNILIQNIDIAMENMDEIKRLNGRFRNVTGTIAHEKYSNLENRQKFGFPLHKFSTYVSPEQYEYKNYHEKKEVLIVSHDEHPMKSHVLNVLHKEFPQLEIRIIEGMTYEDFKKVISEAKWALTFGEGLDNYFIESIFSGGISFSVYNSKFFTEDFASLRTVYSDYDELIQKMSLDLRELNHESTYKNYQQKQYQLCSKYYNYN
jgi:hypothetical protein